ncbi:class I SAM-dependent methyltransferase [Skermania sp. ID1734]|uniref:class I SAM-dependent methyltransferase n=1 Tax=Skermania sp. ID1734 TaxID=2597516 RepID=UPI00117BF3EC|nr:class I SAM-dependent methyltransferase [Skermania sp. ID1734]TSD93443.1 class I SAM-dependent methyltransferase [Skermania sp. ID1734]
MSFYRAHVLPRLVDFTCGISILEPLRERACAGLTGRVLEIGFGSGLNVGHYPPTVTSVSAVEPEGLGWKLARKRLEHSTVPVEQAGLDGQQLPFDDDTFDAALSTFTLCTIPDAAAALREVRRVLKPHAPIHFLEHGLAPDAGVRAWQHRLEPIQKRVAGGCHLTRDIPALITAAGFTEGHMESFYQEGTPRPLGAVTLGARRAS